MILDKADIAVQWERNGLSVNALNQLNVHTVSLGCPHSPAYPCTPN